MTIISSKWFSLSYIIILDLNKSKINVAMMYYCDSKYD
jgi:hypothetical protein